jgi:hypothetical protein
LEQRFPLGWDLFWSSCQEGCVFGFGVWKCRIGWHPIVPSPPALRFGRDDDNTSPRSGMMLDCSANFANVTVCNIMNGWHGWNR